VGEVRSLAFSANGRQLLVGGAAGFVHLYDVTSGELVRRFEGCEDSDDSQNTVHGVALSADGRLALAGGRARRIMVWDAKSGDVLRELDGEGWVNSLALSRDGQRGLSGDFDGVVRLWDVESGQQLCHFETDGLVYDVAFSPDGRRAVAAIDIDGAMTNLGPVYVWDLDTRKRVFRIDAHRYAASSVAVSPDGRYLLSGGHDWTMRLWDMKTGKQVRRFPRHGDWVWSVAFSPDGRFALSAGGGRWRAGEILPGTDFAIRMWDLALATGKETDDDSVVRK
jgi:WD40 repeat protein